MDAGNVILGVAIGYLLSQILVLVLIKLGWWNKIIDWLM